MYKYVKSLLYTIRGKYLVPKHSITLGLLLLLLLFIFEIIF